jgi:hypothetical protein
MQHCIVKALGTIQRDQERQEWINFSQNGENMNGEISHYFGETYSSGTVTSKLCWIQSRKPVHDCCS